MNGKRLLACRIFKNKLSIGIHFWCVRMILVKKKERKKKWIWVDQFGLINLKCFDDVELVFSIWQVSSLFNLQQVHRNLNQTLDICVESKTRICFCKKERKKREILIVQPPRQQKNNFSKKLLNMGADNFMVLRIRWMHKLAMYFKLNLPLQGVTPLP